MSASSPIPVIDMGPLAGADPAARRAAAGRLRHAQEDSGFFYVANHGVPEALIRDVLAASRSFHALPIGEKMAIRMNAAHRGYMPMASSVLVTSSVAKVTKPNMSESFMMMHELPADDPGVLAGAPLQGPNQWPAGLPGFRTAVTAYNDALAICARRLVDAVALAFDLPEDHFAPHFRRPTTWLRLLHYPPEPPESEADRYGSAPHTDYGFLTLLAQDDAGGLEIWGRNGGWIPAPPIPGTYVVNVADMLMRWTNGVLPSTPHRVRNLSGRDRYSVPFFYDPDMDTVVAPLACAVPPGTEPRFKPVRFGDYVMERLDRNYAYRRAAAGD